MDIEHNLINSLEESRKIYGGDVIAMTIFTRVMTVNPESSFNMINSNIHKSIFERKDDKFKGIRCIHHPCYGKFLLWFGFSKYGLYIVNQHSTDNYANIFLIHQKNIRNENKQIIKSYPIYCHRYQSVEYQHDCKNEGQLFKQLIQFRDHFWPITYTSLKGNKRSLSRRRHNSSKIRRGRYKNIKVD